MVLEEERKGGRIAGKGVVVGFWVEGLEGYIYEVCGYLLTYPDTGHSST